MRIQRIAIAGLALTITAVVMISGCSRTASTPLDCRISNSAGSVQVLMLGNSLLHDFNWPLPGAHVFNCAKQGQTLGEFINRWRKTSLPLEQPDVVVIAFGTVEVIRAEKERRHLQDFMVLYPDFLADLQQRWPGARLVVNLLPDINRDLYGQPNLDLSAIDQLNQFIRQSTTCSACQVIDVPRLLLQGEDSFGETLTYDGVHLTEYGYSKWLDGLTRSLATP
jgi:hypothetical protein